jgi:DNA repair exonuclease SbcCD ATPase subunit
MSKKVALEIDIKSQSVGEANARMETAQQELKRLKNELASGELKGEAFDQAARRAGELRDRIGDVNQRVNALASDTGKLDAFVSVAQGVAGGFAAAQGAAALFGSENENLQKTFVKLQAAMATLQGIQAVANTLNKDSAASTILLGRAKTFLSGAITGATAATRAFSAALIATGIGAIVVAVGLLVANWEKLSAAIKGSAKEAEDFATSQRKLADESLNTINTFDEQARSMRRLGFEETEIEIARQQAYINAIERLKGANEASKLAIEENNKSLQKISAWERFGFGLIPRLLYGDKDEMKTKSEEAKKSIEDTKKQIEKLLNDQFDFNAALAAKEERRKKMEADEAKRKAEQRKKEKEKADKEEEDRLNKAAKDRLDARRREEAELQREVDEAIKERNAAREAENERIAALGKEYLDRQKAIFETEKQLREQLTADTISILGSVSNLFEQNSAAQKGFALASIAADTATAIGRALANSQTPTPDNIATGGLAGVAKYAAILSSILSGAAQAKQVLKGGSVTAAPSMGSRVQSIPQNAPQQQQVSGIRVQQQQRVYVLESDISRTQRRVNVIERNGVID